MKKRIPTSIAVSACLLASLSGVPSSVAQNPADILYITEEYPPFNHTEAGKLQGLSVELLEAVSGYRRQYDGCVHRI